MIPKGCIPFVKMHGLGNDYVFIDCVSTTNQAHNLLADLAAAPQAEIAPLAVAMSNRHTGVGGDGIILITPSSRADVGMRIFNADGSEAQMCGNGARCVARYAWERGYVRTPDFTLETLGGLRRVKLNLNDRGSLVAVSIDMGLPVLIPADIPFSTTDYSGYQAQIQVDGLGPVTLTPVSMGNPHGVIFLDEDHPLRCGLSDLPIAALGPLLERHEAWPERANIEFAHVVDRHTIDMRVWERGSGETQACGTGACATAVAAMLRGFCESPVTVRLLGGNLLIEWGMNPDSPVLMTGPAEIVMHGEYIISE